MGTRSAHTARLAILTPILCGLVQMLDGYDLSTIGLAVPSLVATWHLAPVAFTKAFAVSSIGIMIGAMVAGPIADRFGRRPMLLLSVLAFSVFSLLSAWAPSLPTLVMLRFLTGLGIGGAMPTTIALTADFIPDRWRTTVIMFMFCGNTLGGFIAGQIASATLPVWGWQSIFVTGGFAPLVMLPILYVWLPESVHLHAEMRAPEPPPNPVAGLFRNGLAATTLLLWLVFLFNLLNLYLITYWLPTVLSLEGLSPADSAFAASMYSAGGVISTLALGLVLSRIRAERVLAVNISIGIVCVIFVALAGLKGVSLYLLLFGTGAGITGSQLGLNGFAASAYPKELRSTGVGWALGVGRLGGIGGPILGGALLGLGLSPISIMIFVSGPGLVTVAALIALDWIRTAKSATLVQEIRRGTAPI